MSQGGNVPECDIEEVNDFYDCMKGTNQRHPRCVALQGKIGTSAHCGIYPYRSTSCRDFGIHSELGRIVVNAEELARCNNARAAYGLPPILVEHDKHNSMPHLFVLEDGGKIHNFAKLHPIHYRHRL